MYGAEPYVNPLETCKAIDYDIFDTSIRLWLSRSIFMEGFGLGVGLLPSMYSLEYGLLGRDPLRN